MTNLSIYTILPLLMMLLCNIRNLQETTAQQPQQQQQQKLNVPFTLNYLTASSINEPTVPLRKPPIDPNQKVPFKFNNHNNNNDNSNSNSNSNSNTIELISAAILKQQQQTNALNNQQNVMQLIRNMNEKLRQMRSLEMQVATIQEIFDSLHFTAASTFSSSSGRNVHLVLNKNLTLIMENTKFQTWEGNIQHDLELFAKRLTKKLEKAVNLVQDLCEFFQTNITRTVRFTNDYEEEDEREVEMLEKQKEDISKPEFDMDLNDVERPLTTPLKALHLNTYIESMHGCDNDDNDWKQRMFNKTPLNYNTQQIQILNYNNMDKQQHLNNYIDSSLNNELDLNSYVREKLHTIKLKLMSNDHLSMQQEGEEMPPNLKYSSNHLKRIYFLSSSAGEATQHAVQFQKHFHLQYIYTASIQRKYVFLLVDMGSGMTTELMQLTRNYISFIVQLLSPNDLISLLTITDEVENMLLLEASAQDAANGLYWTTRERKDEILAYIHSLVPSRARTNHSLGFDYAFQMLQRLENMKLISTKQPLEFVYITRGLLTNFSDAKNVLQVIAKGQKSLQQYIVINTCAVVLDEKRIMYEKQFLTDIAEQNYSKYDINITTTTPLNGKLFILTKAETDKLINAAIGIFRKDFREPYLYKSWQFHKPVIDEISKESLVSVSHVVPPFGVVGVDLYFNDLIEDINSYQQYQQQQQHDHVYTFLIEMNGNTLVHPAFPKSHTLQQTPHPVDIRYLENATDFINIRQRLLTESQGNATTFVYSNKNRKQVEMFRSYYWRNVHNVYVLCMVLTRKSRAKDAGLNAAAMNEETKSIFQIPISMPLILKHFPGSSNFPIYPDHGSMFYEDLANDWQLIYHRLDLLPVRGNTKLCRYFRQLATNDAATLFLSSSTFQSPFTFLHNNRLSSAQGQLRTMESILAYLKDATGLLANPGLRPHIRQEVNILCRAMQHLKKRHQDIRGSMRQYIIRRYIASRSGVVLVYPGCMLNSNYDPTQRSWFRKAMQHPGKIIATEPYLDAASSGYIITIAHTIFEGKPNALHSGERDQAVAVVALDITYAYFYRMIVDSTALCQLANIKCLMFENEGYLIAHPSMLEPSTRTRNHRRPYEHLTHKESYLASDMLNHQRLVRKLACANYQNRTLQRFYVFNTSLAEILTNVVHGERSKYAVALIRGSNIFAAVLNSTCDGGAFCPCSTIDRQCLNCKRMDPIDCECPCECPMTSITAANGNGSCDDADSCVNSKVFNISQNFSYCDPPTEEYFSLKPQQPFASHESLLLPSCLNINCEAFGAQKTCLAVIGCEWCQQDVEGDNFTTPFCSTQSSCYNGVMASFSPYGDLYDSELIQVRGFKPSPKTASYTAIGPIGGAIAILAIVIGFAIYCYRHNINNVSQEQFYVDSMQEENYGLPLSRFNFDDFQAPDEPSGGGGGGGNNGRGGNSGTCSYSHANAQRSLINAADISPYHMSTGSSYRRPPNGESDQGYSTMTPHEDSSDHQCFTLAEPLLLNDKRNSKSDTMSISTSISSPTNRQQQQQPPPIQSNTNAFNVRDSTRHNLTSPSRKYHSPNRQQQQKQQLLQNHDNDEIMPAPGTTHVILAPVTVHRLMETSES